MAKIYNTAPEVTILSPKGENHSVEVNDHGVALLTIKVPGSVHNILTRAMMEDLEHTLKLLGSSSMKVTALVVASGNKNSFGAGADLNLIAQLQKQPIEIIYQSTRHWQAIFSLLADLPFPTVAAINGVCLGGFLELALACKYRIAAKSDTVKIGFPELNLGFLPDLGGTVRIVRLLGVKEAFPLLAKSKMLDADKAWRLGLVDEIVEPDKLLNRACQLVVKQNPRRFRKPLAKASMAMLTRLVVDHNLLFVGRSMAKQEALKQVLKETSGHYPAPIKLIDVAFHAASMPLRKALAFEAKTSSLLFGSPISRNLVGLYFASEKAKKMPEGIAPDVDVKTVALLGAGVMGAPMAYMIAKAGYTLFVKEIFGEGLVRGMVTMYQLLQKDVLKKKLSKAAAATSFGAITGLVDARELDNVDKALAQRVTAHELTSEVSDLIRSRIKGTADFSEMSECDLVIDATRDIVEIQQGNLNFLEQVIGRPFKYITNTSSKLVGQVGALAKRPQDVAAGHFFNPPQMMPLVEAVSSAETSKETLATLKTFLLRLGGKTVIETRDSPLFLVNRIFVPYMREAMVLAQEGASLLTIDRAATEFGMKMGPIELLDFVGIDIAIEVLETMERFVGARQSSPYLVEWLKEKIQSIKAANLAGPSQTSQTPLPLGQKTGLGFFHYGKDGKILRDSTTGAPELNQEIVSLLKHKTLIEQVSVNAPAARTEEFWSSPEGIATIQKRLFLVFLNEATRALEEGVVSDPALLDLSMIYGTGFPAFRGGILKWADSIGSKEVVAQMTQLFQSLSEPDRFNYDPAALLKKMAEQGTSFYG